MNPLMLIWFLNLACLTFEVAVPGVESKRFAQHTEMSYITRHDNTGDGFKGAVSLEEPFSKNFTKTAGPGQFKCSFGKEKSLAAENAPIVYDCIVLQGLVHRTSGFYTGWNWDMNRQVIIQFGTCKFYMVRTDGKTGAVTIGNLDIESHLKKSIKEFTSDGHVGAIGDMFCWDLDQEEVPVEWGIFSGTTS